MVRVDVDGGRLGRGRRGGRRTPGRPAPASRIRVGERWFTVLGTLEPIELIPELDRAVLVGFPAARTHLRFDGRPTTVYERSPDASVHAVLGGVATAAFALVQGWTPVIPLWAFGGAVAATVLIGAVAGLYPTVRASRLHPTVALNTA